MGVDWTKLPNCMKNDLTERGITPEKAAYMSPQAVLDEFLIWNGIIGWSGDIYNAVHAVDNADTSKPPKI